jgi:uncharacterized protein (TIGR02147 family)
MVNIFEFTDYKEYLQHFFSEKKRENPRFSYQMLARAMGFNNRGFIYNIVQGSKRISKSHCYKISKALGHSKNETEYFENIVSYDQAKNNEERMFYRERALLIRSIKGSDAKLISQDQYEFYSTWYHSAVRSIIGMHQFRGEFVQLAKKLNPAITAAQAKKSVQLLERLGLVVRGNDGIYRLTGKSIRIGADISPTAKTNFHAECTELAKKAIIREAPESRTAISLTLGMSRSTYEIVRNETERFKSRVIELAAGDEQADTVYQYQLVLFPLSNDGKI